MAIGRSQFSTIRENPDFDPSRSAEVESEGTVGKPTADYIIRVPRLTLHLYPFSSQRHAKAFRTAFRSPSSGAEKWRTESTDRHRNQVPNCPTQSGWSALSFESERPGTGECKSYKRPPDRSQTTNQQYYMICPACTIAEIQAFKS